MSEEKQSIFDELERDGLAAVDELRESARLLKERIVQQSHKRIIQFAKLNALGNIIFQEVLEDIRERTDR